MGVEFRILGPLEAIVDGLEARLGGPRQRAVLAVLLLHAGHVVPATRLIDEVWGDDPPETAANLLQGSVSHLRKELGREAIATRDPGYVLRVERDALDLHRFERLAADGSSALADGRVDEAAERLRAALSLWRGDAIADVAMGGVLRSAAGRLDELRLVVLERRLEADLACGRQLEVIPQLEGLVADHPLRERPYGLLMLALYRCGRQADALAAYRVARSTLVEELGLEPGAPLQELERAILRHDPSLDVPTSVLPSAVTPSRTILVAALDTASADRLLEISEPLARNGDRELVLASTVADVRHLAGASACLRAHRDALATRGVGARAAAFTSLMPGADLARMAVEQEADLLLVEAPDGLLEDSRLLALLEDAPCDVAVLVGGDVGDGPVLVPFTGAEHDWAAVELGAWLCRGLDRQLLLAGAMTGDEGRDASRLLASASLAVQRALGVHAEPLLVEPAVDELVEAARGAAIVVVGLTDRWRREGVGRTRTALATSPSHPTLLVRRGLRPGGLAPRSSETRFTWTIGPGRL